MVNKWSRLFARGRIAKRWLFNELVDMFGISPRGKRQNPVWYAEAVWLFNQSMDWMDDDAILPFQAAVKDYINQLKRSLHYIDLKLGYASDELVEQTLYEYEINRECHC